MYTSNIGNTVLSILSVTNGMVWFIQRIRSVETLYELCRVEGVDNDFFLFAIHTCISSQFIPILMIHLFDFAMNYLTLILRSKMIYTCIYVYMRTHAYTHTTIHIQVLSCFQIRDVTLRRKKKRGYK